MPSRHTTKLLFATCAILCLSGSWSACQPGSVVSLGEPLEESSCGLADDESALMQARKVDRWAPLDVIKNAVDKAGGVADVVAETITSTVNSTLETITNKVDFFEEQTTKEVNDAFAGVESAKDDEKLLAFETAMTTALSNTSTAWSSITEAVKVAATAMQSGLTSMGQDDLAGNVKFMLGSALDSAETISQAIAEVNRSVSGIGQLNISGSEAIAAAKLSKLNATLDKALQQAHSFGQYFESAIGELVDGVEEKLPKMGASLAQLSPPMPVAAQPSAIAVKGGKIAELNVFDSFTLSSKKIASKVQGAFAGIVGSARASMAGLHLPPVKGFAWRAAPLPRLEGIAACVFLAVFAGVRI